MKKILNKSLGEINPFLKVRSIGSCVKDIQMTSDKLLEIASERVDFSEIEKAAKLACENKEAVSVDRMRGFVG